MATGRLRIAIVLLGVFLWITHPCLASSDFKVSPHADFKYDSVYYPSKLNSDVNQTDQILNLSVPITMRWGHLVKFKIAPVGQADLWNNSTRERSWVDLPEGYGQIQKGPFTLQAGYNNFTWGATDIFNPLDVVSARRFFDPLRASKLGAPAISLKTDVAVLSLDLIYIPKQRKSILPGENSRWLPREVIHTQNFATLNGPATILVPDNLVYSYSADKELDHATDNNFGIHLSGQLPHFDWALMGFNGEAPAPATSITTGATLVSYTPIVIQANSNITINPIYYRQWVYGGNFVWALGQYIVRGESAFTRPISRDGAITGIGQEHALEIEHNVQIGKDQVTVIVEGTFSKHEKDSDNSSTSLSRVFDRAAILALRYSPTEKWNFLGSAFYDFLFKGNFFHVEGSYALRDALKLNLSLDNLNGPDETPIGTYRKNGRVIAGFSYQL